MEPTTPKINLEFRRELKKVIEERNMLTCRTKKRVCDVLEEMEKETVNKKTLRKVENAIFEIIVSEKAYVNQLGVIKKFFMKPALEQNLLLKRQYQELFGSLDTIYNVNEHLLQDLYKNSMKVAEAFLNFAPYFKLYSSYAVGYKNALIFLQKCKKINPPFFKFLEGQETRPEVQNKLSALLITPIQRLPRYSLLIQNLLEAKPVTDSDYCMLEQALERINEVVSYVNTFLKECENQQRLLEVQRYFKNCVPNVIVPGRVLIKEGILLEFKKNVVPSTKYFVVLLNDIILFSKLNNDQSLKLNSLKCTSIFPLKKCKVQPFIEKGCFEITCENEDINLYHRELSVTSEWIDCLNDAIHTHNCNKKTLRKESSARRPVKRKGVMEYHEESINVTKDSLPKKKQKKTAEASLISDTNSTTSSVLKKYIKNHFSTFSKNDSTINNTTIKNNSQSTPPATGRRLRSASKTLQTYHSTPKANQNHESILESLELKLNEKQISESLSSTVVDNSSHKENENLTSAKKDELFVFGKENPHVNSSFSFKVSNFISNVGLTVKNIFAFRK